MIPYPSSAGGIYARVTVSLRHIFTRRIFYLTGCGRKCDNEQSVKAETKYRSSRNDRTSLNQSDN